MTEKTIFFNTDEETEYDTSDVYYFPFLLTRDTIIPQLCRSLGSFVSYKNSSCVSRQISRIVMMLKAMMERKPNQAKEIADEMIDILLHTGTDDDSFPVYEIQSLFALIGEEKTFDEVFEMYDNEQNGWENKY